MIIIMGLPGAGKTTVLNVLKKIRTDYKFVNYGDLMLQIEQEKGWVNTRDEMRKLSIEKQKLGQGLVAKALAKEKGKLILDTHCAVSTPSGYYPGLPLSFLKGLIVEKLIYITAKPEEIDARRRNDPTRVRDKESLESIKEHDNMNRNFLAVYSAFTGAPVFIEYNKDAIHGETDQKKIGMEAAEKINALL